MHVSTSFPILRKYLSIVEMYCWKYIEINLHNPPHIFTLWLGIILDLMHLKKPGGFDISMFYRDIINVAEDEDLGVQPVESGKLEDLMKKVRAKETKKRALARCVPSIDIWNSISSLWKGFLGGSMVL